MKRPSLIVLIIACIPIVFVSLYFLTWGWIFAFFIPEASISKHIGKTDIPIWIRITSRPYYYSEKILKYHLWQADTIGEEHGTMLFLYAAIGNGDLTKK